MVDHYIAGAATRLSPEAPIPVVLVNHDFYVLGGAANVAHNLAGLRHNSSIFGFLGKDEMAAKVREMLAEKSIGDHTFESAVPTITKTRVVSGNQQIVRYDREEMFTEDKMACQLIEQTLPQFLGGMVVVSDYGKGLCSPALLTSIAYQCHQHNIMLLVDPKGRNWDKYRGAFLVKPNVKELSDIAGFTVPNTDEAVEKHGRQIMSEYNFQNLLITRSEKGMTLLEGSQTYHVQSGAKTVYDVSGAGDTVMAVLCYGLSHGKSLVESMHLASKAASIVIEEFGTSVITHEKLFKTS